MSGEGVWSGRPSFHSGVCCWPLPFRQTQVRLSTPLLSPLRSSGGICPTPGQPKGHGLGKDSRWWIRVRPSDWTIDSEGAECKGGNMSGATALIRTSSADPSWSIIGFRPGSSA